VETALTETTVSWDASLHLNFCEKLYDHRQVLAARTYVLRPTKQIMSPVIQTTHFEETSTLNSRSFGTLSHGME
jgi:hypothetical protein